MANALEGNEGLVFPVINVRSFHFALAKMLSGTDPYLQWSVTSSIICIRASRGRKCDRVRFPVSTSELFCPGTLLRQNVPTFSGHIFLEGLGRVPAVEGLDVRFLCFYI